MICEVEDRLLGERLLPDRGSYLRTMILVAVMVGPEVNLQR